jgi:hypothetical protein
MLDTFGRFGRLQPSVGRMMSARLDWRRATPGRRVHKDDETSDQLARRARRELRRWTRTLKRRDRRWLQMGAG